MDALIQTARIRLMWTEWGVSWRITVCLWFWGMWASLTVGHWSVSLKSFKAPKRKLSRLTSAASSCRLSQVSLISPECWLYFKWLTLKMIIRLDTMVIYRNNEQFFITCCICVCQRKIQHVPVWSTWTEVFIDYSNSCKKSLSAAHCGAGFIFRNRFKQFHLSALIVNKNKSIKWF